MSLTWRLAPRKRIHKGGELINYMPNKAPARVEYAQAAIKNRANYSASLRGDFSLKIAVP
jgi:hypothetical protein